MTSSRFLVVVRFLVVFFLVCALSACAGGGLGGKEVKAKGGIDCRQVGGQWKATEEVVPLDCPIPNRTEHNVYLISQDGCKLTVKDVNRGVSYNGKIKDNIVSWKGNFREESGFVSLDDMSLALGADGNSMRGDCFWTFRGPNDCTGKTRMTLKRVK